MSSDYFFNNEKAQNEKDETTNNGENIIDNDINDSTDGILDDLLEDKEEVDRRERRETPPKDEQGQEQEKEEEQKDKKQPKSDEFYNQTGLFVSQIADIVFPQIAGKLNNKDPREYKASLEAKDEIAKSFAVWFRSVEMELSPLQQLLIALAVPYGLPICMGLYSKLISYLDFNFKEQPPKQQYYEEQNNNSTTTKTETNKPPLKADKITKKCLNCGAEFDVKDGYPKNSPNSYNLSFCGRRCYTIFGNKNNFFKKK